MQKLFLYGIFNNQYIKQFLHAKFQGVTSSTDRRKMNNSSLDSSWQDASNGGIFISLASIDEKLFAFYVLETSAINLLTINAKGIQIPPLDASHHDESNKLCFVSLRSLDNEIMQFNSPKKILSTHFWQVGVIQ